MVVPFERVFGDTSELRVIQFLLPMRGYEFNISEIARGAGVSRQALTSGVVRKLLKWNILKIMIKHGNANYYSLNEDSGFIEAFEDLNNRIVEQMLGEETLTKIAQYSQEHCPRVIPVRADVRSCYINGESSDNLGKWVGLHSAKFDWMTISEESPCVQNAAINRDIVINQEVNYARAA